ncbi:hypothetical protein ABKA04_006947 [Annulohypoxylon sp. FPYF3050]
METQRRQTNYAPRACLSSVPHDEDISDEYLHYTGCVKISEREGYLDTLSTDSQQHILGTSAARNPLMQHDEDTIRYFHLPANNMDWVERAIAKYYGERRHESHDHGTQFRTNTILRPEFWQVQRCFDPSSEVHARHMKPFCDSIPSGGGYPSNMVLFMPYLHWETDIGRNRTAEKIQQVNKEREMEEAMERASIEMADVVMSHQRQLHSCSTPRSTHTIVDATNEGPRDSDDLPELDLTTRKGRMKLIGLILLKAAQVFEAMDFATEECLITEYLHKSPPLHPRRTLDQFYYSSLRSTKTRDRDQVVYRATCLAPPHQGCLVNVSRRKCHTCQRESQKVPRLIMVDQLWLWVLDDKTIITSFPRRWGKIRPDSSDVHEAIRRRLKEAGNSDINSAYDIALMVIDECSRLHEKAYKQAAAFDRFLIYAQIVSRETKGGLWHDAATQHVLLNINSECNMLKQAMDIMDELQIMIRIIEEQRMVVDTFTKQIEESRLSTASSGISSMVLTLGRARRLQVSIEGRLNELRMLLRLAKKTSDALKDLLTIKQQQSAAIEAREAVRNGDEVYMQGKSIMLLTVTTIIFLPLSFMSSLFGMNVVELNSGTLTFSEEFKYMFPIATGVVVVSFFLAFNHSIFTNAIAGFIRAVASFFYNTTLTWLAVRTGWYLLESNVSRKTNSLRNKEIGITGGMKAEALRNEKNIRQMRASQELIKHMEGDEDHGGPGVVINNLDPYDHGGINGAMYFVAFLSVCPTFRGRIVRGSAGNLDGRKHLLGTWAEVNWHANETWSAWGDISILQGNDGAATIESLDGLSKFRGFMLDILSYAPAEAWAQKETGSWCLDKIIGEDANDATMEWEKQFIDPRNVYLRDDIDPVINSDNGRFQVTFYEGIF